MTMKNCLIVVDFQNDFVDGSLGFAGAEKLDQIIESKIKDYLDNNHDLLFTYDTHYEDYLETQEGKRLPVLHCIENTPGHEIYGNTAKYVKNAKAVFKKNTFGSLDLGNFLSKENYDQIELVGLVTNMCVVSNAIIAKAALPEARIVVDRKDSMSFDEDLHHKTFDLLKGIQIDII